MSTSMQQPPAPAPAPPAAESAYCAFSTARAYAAQHRNYGNCQECKRAHQKCDGSDGIACSRCIKHKKNCNLVETRTPDEVHSLMESQQSRLASHRLSEEERRHFGKVLYVRPCNGGAHVEVTHARIGVNSHWQVFLTKCDNNFVPVAPTEYLGPWAQFISRMQASMSEVDVQDMITTAVENNML